MDGDYQFDDADFTSSAPVRSSADSPAAKPAFHGKSGGGSAGGNGSYGTELFSKKISAKFRTFFVDLKESGNGKFIKISEKSNGRKSTIMMDAEDLPEMITALQEVQTKL